MVFDQVSYTWAGKYGLLAEVEGPVKYLTLIEKNYVSLEHPSATDSRIMDTSLTDKQVHASQELSHNRKADHGTVEGF